MNITIQSISKICISKRMFTDQMWTALVRTCSSSTSIDPYLFPSVYFSASLSEAAPSALLVVWQYVQYPPSLRKRIRLLISSSFCSLYHREQGYILKEGITKSGAHRQRTGLLRELAALQICKMSISRMTGKCARARKEERNRAFNQRNNDDGKIIRRV